MRTPWVALVLAALLAVGVVAQAVGAPDRPVKVIVDGQLVALDPPAVERSGVVYVPLRAGAAAVGATLKWDEASATATVTRAGKSVAIRSSQGIAIRNHLLIPLRLMAQALQCGVAWDGAAGAVHVTSQAAAATGKAAPTVATDTSATVVKIETKKGDITCELFVKEAPITAGSFLALVKAGFYDGVTFHRVVPNFVIQGGDPSGNGTGGPGFTIPDEVSPALKHDRGMLSMAKTAAPNTGGSQFFICTGGPETVGHLNMIHAVFGRVTAGMDVVDKIVAGDVMIKVVVVSESPEAAAAITKALAARKPGR
jgi:peptidyl-prolyl cis-trans isomerase B (cyclophilin B)